MNLPSKLEPTGKIDVDLSSGQRISLPKATPRFEKWTGEKPEDTYGGKEVLDAGGEPAFAEIRVLRLLEKTGWTGVWVDSFRRTYRKRYWQEEEPVELPDSKQQLISEIDEENESASGCFDIYCWRGRAVLFAEAKRKNDDSIRETQKQWMESALSTGVPLNSLLVVEWDLQSAV